MVDEPGELNLPAAGATEVTSDPADPARYFLGVPGHGVFRSTDGGARWQRVTTGIAVADIGTTRVLLTIHRNLAAGTAAVYAAMVIGSEIASVYRSANFGDTWTKFADRPATGVQGETHSAIVADPIDANIVYVGGQPGGVFRGDFATGQWTHLLGETTTVTLANAELATYSHADIRELLFDIDRRHLLQASDGGVYRLRNPNANVTRPYFNARLWESLNRGLTTTEFWRIAYDPVHDIIFGGTQDNHSVQQFAAGERRFDAVHGGDGGAVGTEVVDPNTVIRYTMGNNFLDFRRRTFGKSNGVTNRELSDEYVLLAAPNSPDEMWSGLTDDDRRINGFDVHPFKVNAVQPSRTVLGTRNGLYESQNRADGTPSRGDIVANVRPNGMGFITAIAYGGRRLGAPNADIMYVGAIIPNPFQPQVWLRTTGGGALTRLNNYAGGFVTDIALDPDDWQTAYVLDWNGCIWRTADAGANWQDLSQDPGGQRWLPTNLHTIAALRIGGTPVLLVGGSGGVYRRINPAIGANSTSWSELGRGLPNTLVMDLVYDPTDRVLLAGTFGRGAWTLPNADGWLPMRSTLTISGDRTDDDEFVSANRNDIIRLAQNPLHPNRLDVYVNNVSGWPEYSVESAAVQAIHVYSGGGNDFIEIDYLPPNTTLTVYAGSGEDVIRTTSANLHGTATFDGQGDPDWFVMTPTPTSAISVLGGSPAAPSSQGDGLRVLAGGAPYSITPGQQPDEGVFQVVGFRPIFFDDIETATGGGALWRADRFEPNDTRESAFDLVGGDQTQLGLTLHDAGNADWYRWRASDTGNVVVRLIFAHRLGDLELELYDSAGNRLARSISSDDDEYIVHPVSAMETYYIHAYGYLGATHPDYILAIDWPFGVASDTLEPNDNFADAYDLGIGDQTQRHLTIHDAPGERAGRVAPNSICDFEVRARDARPSDIGRSRGSELFLPRSAGVWIG